MAKHHMRTVDAQIRLTPQEEQHFSAILAPEDSGRPLTKLDVRILVIYPSSAIAAKGEDEIVNYFANLQEALEEVSSGNPVEKTS
ncbi:hypothetical protein EVAR_103164_1 [Eumeta japonica]|uniref:Uncharacterized protein n=1 Tax=Eumeta variegata TaxID=151549 RepID=A0A4C1YJK6_EUMVA|nr:hypothetical protein EVAR_103164_1 [Eumeta japonica]